MLIVRCDTHLGHHCPELDGGRMIPSWEGPVRAERVDAAIDALDGALGSVVGPEPFDDDLAARVHDPAYIEFLVTAWDRWLEAGHDTGAAMGMCWPARRFGTVRPRGIDGLIGYHSFALDCSITAGTWPAVEASAATADTAARHVADTGGAAFARCRPPGHHAMRDQFGGYCYLNNAAVAAERILEQGAERVAILDVDYHHGNGTQDIYYSRADVRFCSIHADPLVEFPYFLGHADETGAGPGEGSNLNLPLPHGTEAESWFAALGRGASWLAEFEPDALVVSLGVDTFEFDPISRFRLGTDHFPQLGKRLADLDLPTVLVMEGGYATGELGENIVGVLRAFGGV